MKLLRETRPSPLLGSLLVTLALGVSCTALADNDFRGKGGHNGRDASHHNSHDRSWNGRDHNKSRYDRHQGSRFGNDRHNRRRTSWGRHNSHDNFSLNLSLGSGYYGSGYGSSLWYGTGVYNRTGIGLYNNWYSPSYSSFTPFSPYRNTRTVVVKQPTVVYVNDPAPPTRRVISSHVVRESGVSLLRDIHGNCYERQTDSYGNETRIQLPASSCQF